MFIPRHYSALALAVAIVAAPAVNAQDVQYSTVTKVDLGGVMNTMMRFAGGTEFKETAYIKGKKLRSDSDKQSIIFDLENSRYIILDHAAKTYTSVPLAGMMGAATSAVRGVKADASSDQLKGTAVDSAGNKADFTVDVKVDPTGEKRKINGTDAERVMVTMVTDIDVTPQGESQSQNAGKLVVLMDTWNANTGPASEAVRAWEQAASKELAAAAFGGRGDFGKAFAANPKMGEAVKKASEEAQKVDGIAVLSTMHLVVVAPDQKFDRALALKEAEPAPKSRGLGGLVRGAIESSAGVQSRDQKSDEKKPEPTQGTLAKVTTEIKDVKATALQSTLFDIPAGYREVPSTPPNQRE